LSRKFVIETARAFGWHANAPRLRVSVKVLISHAVGYAKAGRAELESVEVSLRNPSQFRPNRQLASAGAPYSRRSAVRCSAFCKRSFGARIVPPGGTPDLRFSYADLL
jgi:hypothetical protein